MTMTIMSVTPTNHDNDSIDNHYNHDDNYDSDKNDKDSDIYDKS